MTEIEFSYKPINPFQDDGLSKEDRAIIDAACNAAYVCGYGGEDVEYAIHQALKRMGRYDPLPPYELQESEVRNDTDRSRQDIRAQSGRNNQGVL